MKRAFLDKILARLRRIQPEEVEAFFVELARDKRFLETIFNAIREGVIVTDTAGTVIYMNDAAGLLFGLDPAAADFLAPELKSRNVLLELDLAPGLPVLEVDQDQLKQAFYNIVKNASEAMKQGGLLKIRTASDHEWINVMFTDTGGGMSQETMARIFEPYFTTKKSGSGLGLMITQRIIRAHGGEVVLESDPGQGLRITLRLPRHDRQVQMLAAPSLPLPAPQ